MTIKGRLQLGVLVLASLILGAGVVGGMHLSGTPQMLLLALVALAVLILVGLAALTQRAITAPLATAVGLAKQVAAGDLTDKIVTDGKGEFGRLMLALQSMHDNLTRMVSDIRSGAEAIRSSAEEVATGNANLSQRTEEQASTLEETASSMEQLTSAVRENTENAGKANALAKNANAVAAQGGMVVNEVVATMNQIQESSRKIADIISVIDSIAFQTNILALNAAVEAARAGEQGRGFAVVASEVRSLAQRSADAAKEIKGLISNSVERVDAGTRLVENAGKTMGEIVDSVAKVNDIIDQIATASTEQSAGIAQVSQAINQMDHVVQQNAAVVEEATAAAESMRAQAQRLNQVASVFKLNEDDASRLNRRRDPTRSPVAPPVTPAVATDRRSANVRPTPAQRTANAAPAIASPKPPAADDGEWKEF
jgi:methyl-accepting chemotaxis protein